MTLSHGTNRTGIVLCSIIVIFLTSCQSAAFKKPHSWVNPHAEEFQNKVFAILDFEDRNIYKEKYPESSHAVRESFETAFLQMGYNIVERSRVSKVLLELKFSLTFGEDELIEVGKMLNADVVILGTVTTFFRGQFGGPYTTVGFSIKAVHVESGTILWKAYHAKSTNWDYKYDPGLFSMEIADELVKKLMQEKNIINNAW